MFQHESATQGAYLIHAPSYDSICLDHACIYAIECFLHQTYPFRLPHIVASYLLKKGHSLLDTLGMIHKLCFRAPKKRAFEWSVSFSPV